MLSRPKISRSLHGVPNNIAAKLRRLAKADSRTNTDLAKASGVTLTAFSRFMNEHMGISFPAAAKLAKALGYTLNVTLEPLPAPPRRTPKR